MMGRNIVFGIALLPGLAGMLAACPYAPGPSSPSKGALLRLAPVAEDLDRPLFVTSSPADPGLLFIVEQAGRIVVVQNGTRMETPFLDIRDRVGSTQGERGLLGLAFHPQYASNGHFFVNFTNTAGNTVVARFRRSPDDPARADPASTRIVLSFEQPFSTHNSGMLAFGPDGYLYIGSGDGGSANDPMQNGQALDTLLGKVLRIDVDGDSPYTIPPDNPFVGVEGARDEIWAYGLRNPWRFSFDRETGDLWLGDVGQFALEEVNYQPAGSAGGENYGWQTREGYLCGEGVKNCELPGAVDPLHAYFNLGSQSVTGGYVYRGGAVPELAGVYFFGDYISASIYALTRENDGSVTVSNETRAITGDNVRLSNVASFGQDSAGELYIVDYGAGVVYAMSPA